MIVVFWFFISLFNNTIGYKFVEFHITVHSKTNLNFTGARNIRIEEVAEANNYLAVKSEGDEYYLNGHWYIQWTGNYNMAGTTVHYERMGNKEGITAPGPIKEPLHIMVRLAYVIISY